MLMAMLMSVVFSASASFMSLSVTVTTIGGEIHHYGGPLFETRFNSSGRTVFQLPFTLRSALAQATSWIIRHTRRWMAISDNSFAGESYAAIEREQVALSSEQE